MTSDLLRLVDSISRDKAIDKGGVFSDLEAAIESAVRKANVDAEVVVVSIDQTTGAISASVDGKPVEMKRLGRIAAQSAKQVLLQRVREDERNSIFEEYSQRVGTVVTGTVTRYEGGMLIVNLGRAEGILPRSEQIPGESHHTGERLRSMILDVREEQNRVRIVLTQAHPDYIRRLFELEVPEVGERIIEIRGLAREAGYRTKVAVSSIDSKVDAVGACVGVRGSRIRNIVDELGGEKIDIVRWNESSQVLISNSLKPAEIKETFLCFELSRATVIVDEDQLSLAIGKRGQNVRLAARLTGWDIDILTPEEYDKGVDAMERTLKGIDGVEDVLLDKLLAMGIISLGDLVGVGPEPLVKEVALDEALAARLVEVAAEAAKRFAEEAEVAKKEAAEKAAAEKLAAEAEASESESETSNDGAVLDENAEAPTVDGDDASLATEASSGDALTIESMAATEPAEQDDILAQAADSSTETSSASEPAGETPQPGSLETEESS